VVLRLEQLENPVAETGDEIGWTVGGSNVPDGRCRSDRKREQKNRDETMCAHGGSGRSFANTTEVAGNVPWSPDRGDGAGAGMLPFLHVARGTARPTAAIISARRFMDASFG
jgi:hypothetical protein